jgi:eukaryotic-like serine/threonine-protein kinase
MDHVTERFRSALAGRYAIQRELGRGGMATVFLAEDLKHHRQVALKVLNPELAEALGGERFLREIEIAAGLHHPHILPLYDSGDAAGLLYYVMPYAEGESLRDRLAREKQLPVGDALRIAREVADALSYAHSRGVVHRDIKPENILLESGHAVVADFGIARAISAAGGEQLTATGLAIGTPAYMSPEQAAGSKALDGRGDLYSLACVLYEMLAGQPPFTGATVESLVYQHLTASPPDITSIRPAVPGWVAAALERALAKTPADRFSPVALFAEALSPRESAVAAAVAAPPPAARRVSRLALIAVPAILVVGAALLLRPFGGEPPVPAYPRTALAVLPFQSLSADAEHAYFAGGLHDELLTQLSRMTALSLRGRTSVMGYAGTSKSIRQIAEELEVGALLEGSVQVVGGRLRVNVQLIDAATDAHLWADSYDRTLDDAFAIQSDVAQRVVEAVGAVLGSAERAALTQVPTANAEAYRLYLQGREYHRRPGQLRQNWESAQQLYERALELDPEFVLAWAALSEVHGQMHWFRYDTSPERVARQREAAEATFRLAPEEPAARMAMGLWHYFGRRDWPAALREFDVALQGMPNDPRLVALIGFSHRRMGNWDDVIAAFERATELDPRDAQLFFDLGGASLLAMRRYAEAVRVHDRALRFAPDHHGAAVSKGWVYVQWQGQLDTLRSALARVPSNQFLDDRARSFFWERDADRLLAFLATQSDAAFVAQYQFLPRSLFAAWAHALKGDGAAARAAFDSALVVIDSAMRDIPDDFRLHAARGLALAGLGRSDAALREAAWLQGSLVYREDALTGPRFGAYRAQILAQAGEADAALDEIERILSRPASFSVHNVRLDPLFDPLRGHPRYHALLARYGER